MKTTIIVGMLMGSLAAGCGGSALVNQRAQKSTAAIRAAEEVGAQQVPRASYYLQLAREESERAKQLASNGKKKEAASRLLRAEADAELALTLAREDAERKAANDAMERVKKLQQENGDEPGRTP